MKHLSILLFTLVFSGYLLAQKNALYTANLNNHRSIITALTGIATAGNANLDTRSLTERVIGQSTKDNMFGTFTDSVNVTYPLNGTSTYDFNMMLYAYNYPYSTTPMFNFLGTFTSPQVLHKTYNHFTVNPNTLVYGFYEKSFNTYDANKNLTNDTTFYADSLMNPNMIYDNRFNAANKVDTSYSYTWTGGVASNAFKQFFTYNGANLVTKDSIYEFYSGSWYLVSKTYYTYDGSNNLILIDNYANVSDPTFTLPLVHQLKYVNTYDGSNRLKTVETSFYDGTALLPYVRDTFNYTLALPFHTDWKEYQYDPINAYWAPMYFMDKHLNVAGYPDTVYTNTFDSLMNMWVPYYMDVITYNASNNPTRLDDYIFNFVTFPSTPDFTTKYYYETFTNTTSVTESNPGEELFNLYPNPNDGNMNLTYELTDPALLTFFDCLGKKINSYPLVKGKNTLSIAQNNLNKGIYFYQVTNHNTTIYSNKFIVR